MKLILFLAINTFAFLLSAQPLAFPGADGGGKFTTGGRGGKVLFVDNLNDKGQGSLREAIEETGPRIIVFRVSGNIELRKTIHIKNGDLTIAGQTAPGQGICLKNYGIRLDADNVIIRYIRIRPGDEMQEENDAFYGYRNKNIIIDHCSFSWAIDEVASFYDNENFTMQWCILSESLYQSAHHKGEHGYGGIWGGLNATFHHNLISDHTSRNPRLCGARYTNNPDLEKADIRNNVIYNWGFNTIYGGESGNYNIVNNYYKPGPATSKKTSGRILNLTTSFFDPDYNTDTLGAGKFFIAGNVVEGNPGVSRNNWNGGVQGSNLSIEILNASRLPKALDLPEVKTSKARKAYSAVLNEAGASLYRDPVDARIIAEVRSGKEQFGGSYEGGGKGIIDSQQEVGGWPELESSQAPADSDNDGMPDEWELNHKLNPGLPNHHTFELNSSYCNLEVYLNELVK